MPYFPGEKICYYILVTHDWWASGPHKSKNKLFLWYNCSLRNALYVDKLKYANNTEQREKESSTHTFPKCFVTKSITKCNSWQKIEASLDSAQEDSTAVTKLKVCCIKVYLYALMTNLMFLGDQHLMNGKGWVLFRSACTHVCQ